MKSTHELVKMDNVDCKLISQKEPHTFVEKEKKVYHSFIGVPYCSHSHVFISLMGNVMYDYFIKNVKMGVIVYSNVNN